MTTASVDTPKQVKPPRSPKTPESQSPREQSRRKKNSPISALTKSSWHNFRSKFGKASDLSSSPTRSPEFFVIATESPKKKRQNPAFLDGNREVSNQTSNETQTASLGPPLELSSEKVLLKDAVQSAELNQDSSCDGHQSGEQSQGDHGSMHDSHRETSSNDADSDSNFETITRESSRNSNDNSNIIERGESSDNSSQYSFSRVNSVKYYKPETSASAADVSSYLNNSFLSRSSIISGESESYNDIDWDADDDLEDLSHLEEADMFADSIAEANQIPIERHDDSPPMERTKSSGSMHRQSSQKVTREDSVITFFNETTPKRAKSHSSTSSSVFPILE